MLRDIQRHNVIIKGDLVCVLTQVAVKAVNSNSCAKAVEMSLGFFLYRKHYGLVRNVLG